MKNRIMKKFLFFALALLAMAGTTMAQNTLVVPDIEVPQIGEASLTVNIQFEEENIFAGAEFHIVLPEGFSFVMDESGDATDILAVRGDCLVDHGVAANLSEGVAKVSILSVSGKNLRGTTGSLASFRVYANEEMEIGSTHTGRITDIYLADDGGTAHKADDGTFTITISDGRVVLNENSTTLPDAATGVNVRVKRTINAGSWSTICLPFAMTEEQCKEAFGQGVKIADFMGTESEYDDDDNVVGIKANFQSVTSMEDNHPYIIKVKENVTEFTINGVDIDPDEGACIEFDNGKTGARRIVYSGFYGTYVANTLLDEFTLFLSGNKFYYSAGKTKMKAFRAFFDFLDILTDVEDNAGAKIAFLVDNTPASIEGLATNGTISNGAVYTVGGQLIGRNVDERQLKKGVYIRNGKKFVVK